MIIPPTHCKRSIQDIPTYEKKKSLLNQESLVFDVKIRSNLSVFSAAVFVVGTGPDYILILYEIRFSSFLVSSGVVSRS